MTKMKPMGWFDRDRNSRLANVLYPYLSDPQTQQQVLKTSEVEQKRAGLERRMKAGAEQYRPKGSWWSSKAEPNVPGNYDRVPGLKRSK
jgi:hypothetical protein